MAGMHAMPRHRALIGTLISFCVGVAASDSGDDFSSNLFSDLGPYVSNCFPTFFSQLSVDRLLALFGEKFANQFLSESYSWADSIIFACAPLGAITAIVGATRVAGPKFVYLSSKDEKMVTDKIAG
jgi:hypothetical protein